MSSVTIETIDAPPVDVFHRRYVAASVPVLIRGAVDGWPALDAWKPRKLAAAFADRQVSVSVSRDGLFRIDPETGRIVETRAMTFADFVEQALAPQPQESLYLQATSLPDVFPELVDDITVTDYLGDVPVHEVNFWFGGGDNISALHYDTLNNFLIQVAGKKRLVLFAPDQLRYLYPYSRRTRTPQRSQVNLEQPDPERFPEFTKAESVEVTVGPGEMLFIPLGWWHQVYTVGLSISLNMFWATRLRQCFIPAWQTCWSFWLRGKLGVGAVRGDRFLATKARQEPS